MEWIFLKTAVATIEKRLSIWGQRIINARHPYKHSLMVLVIFTTIGFINSLVRHPYIYNTEMSVSYATKLYIGGFIGFIVSFLLKTIFLYLILKRALEKIRFSNFYFGVLLFSFPIFVATMINIIVPILIIESYKSINYSILSIAYIFDIELHKAWAQIAVNMLDFFEIVQIIILSVFLKSVSHIDFFKLVLITSIVHYLLYLGATFA